MASFTAASHYSEVVTAVPEQDGWILSDVDRALADGARLLRWWERTDAARSYRDSFRFLQDLTQPDRALGFFDEAEISTGSVGVMGLVHEMLFDQPKSGPPETYCAQMREFVLGYFLRVTHMTPPQPKNQLGIGPDERSAAEALAAGAAPDGCA